MPELAQLLENHHLRRTSAREQVFAALLSSREPLSIHELTLRCSAINRTSVYRVLELFTQLNVVTAVHIGWKKRYELAAEYQKHHHHHLVCESCATITEIHSAEFEASINTLATTYDFTPSGHTFEITGLCQNCQNT